MPQLLRTENFCIFNLSSDQDWNDFKSTLFSAISDGDFGKIRDYLKGIAKAVIIEFKYVCKDYRDTFHNFYSKKFKNYESKCVRLHFFNSQLNITNLWKLEKYCKNYIGYIILRPLDPFSIGRTMLNPWLIKTNHYLCTCENEVNLLGAKFEVSAFPFMEQDTEVSVCAHAAIWAIFRYFSQRYHYYREIYPFQIAKLTSDVSLGRPIPSRGLTVFQISEIVSNYGMYPAVYFRSLWPDDFEKILYYYIESGIPVVASLKKEHAVAIIGHSSNLDFSSLQEHDYRGFKYFNSADLTTGYIINDDNYLPYRYLMKTTTTGKRVSLYKINDIDAFIAPLYEKIFLSADALEEMTLAILSNRHIGFQNLSKKYKNKKLILRIFLTSSRSYKKFRKNHPIYAEMDKIYIELPMPKFIWMVELSTVDKYKKNKVIGEIIFDSTANKYDNLAFMYIHYPGVLIINDRNKAESDPSRLTLSEINVANIKDYDIYISNLKGEEK